MFGGDEREMEKREGRWEQERKEFLRERGIGKRKEVEVNYKETEGTKRWKDGEK